MVKYIICRDFIFKEFKICLKYVLFLVFNLCEVNNGNCSYLCLLVNIEIKFYICRCSNGMNIIDNGRICIGIFIIG